MCRTCRELEERARETALENVLPAAAVLKIEEGSRVCLKGVALSLL